MYDMDLIAALTVITVLSVFGYRAGRRLGLGIYRSRPLLFVESLLLALVFAWSFAGNLSWAHAVPGSGVIYWSNLMPVILAFAAGLATQVQGLERWGRPITVLALSAIALVYLARPISRPFVAPASTSLTDKWDDGVCLQSHEATCAAAAASTLLRLKGLHKSEHEMVDLCLTSQHGTEPLGLYRGLKLAVSGTGRQVKVASHNPSEWISKHQLPNVALIRFSNSRSNGSMRILGPLGEGHAVVVLGHVNNQWILGDPAVGRVVWSDDDFRRRFTGDAIFLDSQ